MRSRARDGGLVRVTGYTFRADIYCPSCIGREISEFVRESGGSLPEGLNRWQVEAALDAIAEVLKVDRDDEVTFDSDDFPKVILSIEDDGLACGTCGEGLD